MHDLKRHALLKPFKKQSENRYLVVSRASDSSRHKEWLEPSSCKNFDLFLEYYGTEKRGVYEQDCDIYSEAVGVKWGRFHRLIEQHGESFFRYDAVWFPDDDVSADCRAINRMFDIFSARKLELAQAALTPDSCDGWEIEYVDSSYVLRYTNFVHCMAPIFSREALKTCWFSFGKSQIGFGLDFLWPQLLGFPKDKIAVIDAVTVKHTRPRGQGTILNDCYELGINPGEEFQKLAEQYGISLSYTPVVYGGIKA